MQKSKLWRRRALIPLLSPAQPRLTEFPVLAEAGGGADSAGANSCGCPEVSSGLSCAAETLQFPSERISPRACWPQFCFRLPQPWWGTCGRCHPARRLCAGACQVAHTISSSSHEDWLLITYGKMVRLNVAPLMGSLRSGCVTVLRWCRLGCNGRILLWVS